MAFSRKPHALLGHCWGFKTRLYYPRGNPMPVVHSEPFRARYYECDAHGHLTQLTYLRWMQEAAFAASVAAGYDFARYTGLVHAWVIHESQLNYLAPVHYEDQIVVRTWVADFRRWHSQRR